MALTVRPSPDHIQFPRGVQCLDCLEFVPAELERCMACGSSAVALREEGEWDGGKPEVGIAYLVEIDVSTGLVGYARPTKKELAELSEQERLMLAAEAILQKKLDDRTALIRAKAAEDPAYAALAEHLGIRLES